MIRHNDERIEIVAFAVEMVERVSDDSCQRGLAEDASAMTGIEPLIDPTAE